jgi:hypothetical protein
LAENIDQPIEVFQAVNWNALEHVVERNGFATGHETIRNLLSILYRLQSGNIGFVSYAWYRMFSIRENIYRELVVEFYSTFRFEHRSTDWTAETITFQLGGRPRRMSLVEFAIGIGLYESNEIHNPHFLDHISAGAVAKLTDLEIAEEWQYIAQGNYGDTTPSYRAIRDPRYRLIHRLLTFTIVGRREGPEKVSKPDLFYLSSIVRKRLVNVPWRLARWMSKRATGTRSSSSLCGGQFITRLARHFGLETPDEIGTCTVVQPGMEWLTLRRLEALDLIEPCSLYGGDAELYYWVTTTPVGQVLQPRQARAAEAGRGAARGRSRGYAGEFDRLSQQIDQMSLHHTQRFDQLETMERQHFHQTSAHLDYQDSLFSQLFDYSHLPYQPFAYQMPPEYMPPPAADQPGPSYHYRNQEEDDSD